MSKGALLQLNYLGSQDQILTLKEADEVSLKRMNFIKQVYRKYINFAIQKINLYSKQQVIFNKKVIFTIDHLGDLVNKMYFAFTLPPLSSTSGTYAGWTNSIGYALINDVELEIGGVTVDKHYGLFLEIWYELTTLSSLNNANRLIGKYDNVSNLKYNALTETSYYVPLYFWFNIVLQNALPLVCLQFTQVVIKITLNSFDNCIVYDGATPPEPVEINNGRLIAEYIYLEDEERKKYTHTPQKYIIKQVQNVEPMEISSTGISKLPLDINHPCNELLFVCRELAAEQNNDWFNFAQVNFNVHTPVLPLITQAKLLIDGNDYNDNWQEEKVLRILNMYRYHTNTTNRFIYSIPFCDKPEAWYPNGSLNFSMVSNADLLVDVGYNSIPNSRIFIFAINFNVIYIEDGILSIKYSC